MNEEMRGLLISAASIGGAYEARHRGLRIPREGERSGRTFSVEAADALIALGMLEPVGEEPGKTMVYYVVTAAGRAECERYLLEFSAAMGWVRADQ